MNEILTNVVNKAIATLDHIKSAIIRNGVDVPEGSSTATYAEKIDEVFDAGIDSVAPDIEEQIQRLNGEIEGAEGGQTLKEQIFEAGKKSEYDAFWDAYQDNGDRVNYAHAFRYGWQNDIFKPKYDLKPTNAASMFASTNIVGDLVMLINQAGVTLDFSESKNVETLFYNAENLSRVGVIDIRNATNFAYMFESAIGLITVDKVILKSDGSQAKLGFHGARSLQNIIIEGTIGQNGFNVSWSPLNKASLTSIINALSTTTTGLTVTLRLDAVNKAFETSEGAMDGSTSNEWLTLAATKSNWTISLINS